MSEITPEQLATKLDRDGTANDTQLLQGRTLDELYAFVESEGRVHEVKSLGGFGLDDFYAIAQQAKVYAEEVDKFGGLTVSELKAQLNQLVETRTFQPTFFTPTTNPWTLLVTVEIQPDREDFVFGLMGGGSEGEQPLVMLRVGAQGRPSLALALAGQINGQFYSRSRSENDVIFLEIWHTAERRDTLHMACLNSTRAHTYGPCQFDGEVPPIDTLFPIVCDEAITTETFIESVTPLQEELKALKETLLNRRT